MSALLTEQWAWFALTIIVVLARMVSRRMLYGSFKAMRIDDYLMLLVVATYTILLVIVYVLTYTPTNLINPDDHIELSEEDVKKREYGSKLVLVTEQMQMLTLWGVKSCLLIMYSKLTTSLKRNIWVKVVAAYTAICFVVMQILFFAAWCRPFHFYWKVPAPNLNCSAETNHMITNAVTNISTDLLILLLPMPVFIQSQLPLKRKLVLCGVFALGIFTILAASLSKYYSLHSPYGSEWIYWYIREVSTAIITANLPLTWTLLQHLFRLGSFHAKYGRSSQRTGENTARFRSNYGNLTSCTRDERSVRRPVPDPHNISPSESQEEINGTGGNVMQLKILQQHEVHITTEELSSSSEDVGRVTPHPSGSPGQRSPTASLSGDKSVNEGDLGIVTKVYRGV